MKLTTPLTVRELAGWLKAESEGPEEIEVTGINEIHKVESGDLTFVDHPKYFRKALQSKASVVLINERQPVPEGKALILSDDPFRDFNRLTRKFYRNEPITQPISESATIGEGTRIEPGVVIGNDVVIGKDCTIHANVVIYNNCHIGNEVIIHANTVIGSDAFYFKRRTDPFYYDKLESCGRVLIKDRVEIGAGCTIDRGVSGDTILGEGTKLDNMVHIGHGVVTGKHCLFAAQVAIGGKTTLGDRVILWGQVGITKDVVIEDDVVVLAQSGVGESLPAGKSFWGSPSRPAMEKMRELATLKHLPHIFNHWIRNRRKA